eukprot:1044856-Rhodomonas_salina.2
MIDRPPAGGPCLGKQCPGCWRRRFRQPGTGSDHDDEKRPGTRSNDGFEPCPTVIDVGELDRHCHGDSGPASTWTCRCLRVRLRGHVQQDDDNDNDRRNFKGGSKVLLSQPIYLSGPA